MRLLARLSGRNDGALADLGRLLEIRLGDCPARPDLGLPDLPPWLPDDVNRRRVQQAIAATVRGGEPRFVELSVHLAGSDEQPVYSIRARTADGDEVGVTARGTPGGGLEMQP